MSTYHNFIGIDIGKFSFTVAVNGSNSAKDYDNDDKGIKLFINDFKDKLPASLVILEATGGYEIALITSLYQKKVTVHRANCKKVKNYIRSIGNGAKTDALDAKALAAYGKERHASLELYVPPSEAFARLQALALRRLDLKKFLVAEKNRLQGPKSNAIKQSCEAVIAVINEQLSQIKSSIEAIIKSQPALLERFRVVQTIPGVGEITGQDLIALMPELGTINRKQIASLAGLAPRANDSGKFKGYRTTAHGRSSIKPILFLAAMAAGCSKSPLGAFYKKMIDRDKKKMVALTALMRKIIVIANARLKEHLAKEAVVVADCEKSA